MLGSLHPRFYYQKPNCFLSPNYSGHLPSVPHSLPEQIPNPPTYIPNQGDATLGFARNNPIPDSKPHTITMRHACILRSPTRPKSPRPCIRRPTLYYCTLLYDWNTKSTRPAQGNNRPGPGGSAFQKDWQ